MLDYIDFHRADLLGMRFYSITKASHSEAWAGILVAHASHLGSVLVLHGLSKTIFLSHVKARQIAFISACLHIISPAGLFLSAPYSESLFAFLQFTAFYFYARATFARQPTSRDGNTLLAGLFLGAASVIRSNALLGGILFAYDAVTDGIRFIQAFGNTGLLRKLMVTGLAGSFVAIGFVLPQYIAHTEYCEIRDGVPVREWCSRSIPSIYTFVQSFYWYVILSMAAQQSPNSIDNNRNVGFLRYWTLSNVPLFLIATPMLSILIYSSYWTFVGLPTEVRATSISTLRRKDVLLPSRAVSLVQLLACTQAALAALAITNYHIQIITRLASGYPVWYWWLAIAMSRPPKADERGNKTRVITRWMLMYAVIQGGLFASFLPPA